MEFYNEYIEERVVNGASIMISDFPYHRDCRAQKVKFEYTEERTPEAIKAELAKYPDASALIFDSADMEWYGSETWQNIFTGEFCGC